MKRPKEPATTNAEWVRLYTWRVHKILTAALNGKRNGSRAWLAVPKGEERSRYLELRAAAKRVNDYVDQCEKNGDTTPIDMMRQYAILHNVWDKWRERRAAPIWENYRAVKANRTSAARKKSEMARVKANVALEDWSSSPRRRQSLAGLSREQVLDRFIKVGRPKRSVVRQLRKAD